MTEPKYFGVLPDGRIVRSITISSKDISAEILDYGANLRSLRVLDRDGNMRDVVLGYDSLEDYRTRSGKLGATVGRFAGRIEGSGFTLDGKRYDLSPNKGDFHMHGGFEGFDRKLWEITESKDDSVTLHLVSEDGEEGYPGRLDITVRYTVNKGSITIDYHAVSDKDTICNLTNHSYFNLASEGKIDDHVVRISSDSYLETNGNIPTGKILPVTGTYRDLREPKTIGDLEFDDCYPLMNGKDFAEVYCERTGIRMTVSTDLPLVVFYTSGNLKECTGKNGARYGNKSGLCLETQFHPNSPNIPEFPSCVLRKGKEYRYGTTYSFSVS